VHGKDAHDIWGEHAISVEGMVLGPKSRIAGRLPSAALPGFPGERERLTEADFRPKLLGMTAKLTFSNDPNSSGAQQAGRRDREQACRQWDFRRGRRQRSG
jgi:hypothetical protein